MRTLATLASFEFIQTKSRILICSYHVETLMAQIMPAHRPSLINIFVVHYDDNFVFITKTRLFKYIENFR